MFRTPLTLFRSLAVAEAVSWTLLIAALILRATSDLAIAVTIAGGIHGFVFLSYGVAAVLVAKNQRWSIWPTIAAIVSAIVPYATIPVELWLHRTGRLAGEWRLIETADARDRSWHDRLMRAMLRRPWLLGLLLVVAIVVVFVVLLIVGPPGGRA
ncbi:MAG: DUF3817 domain-containing protein [Actinobacteria bacterium]|nr:DUF3817 domain-containing protein [Actinomycetota bacterium]